MSGLPSGPLQASFLGIPLGSGEVSGSTFDPDYLKFTAAGVVELTSGDTSVPVRVSNDPWATAPFVVAVMLALGGLASVSSNMRAMRSRRLRIGAYVGLFISGALAAAAIAVLAMIVLEAATVPPVVPAVLGGLAAVLLGEAYRRIRRRRRLKRIQVARARR